MQPLPKKPITQILIFGFLLAIILLIVFGPKLPSEDDNKVVIGDAVVAQLIANWQRTWNRMPTMQELRTVMDNHVREEILYREALNQNLDENNAVVRRGLIQQMNMLSESQGADKPITDEAIEAYYDLRKDRFFTKPAYTFTQIYFDVDTTMERLESIRNDLNRKNIPPDSKDLPGISSMLRKHFDKAPSTEINRVMGQEFSQQLNELELNAWTGPVRSGFGNHLIYISKKTSPEPIPIDLVRENIITELRYEEVNASKEQFFTELRQQYEVIYEGVAKDLIDG